MAQSTVNAELHAGFRDANPEFSPVPIWWWSGEGLDIDRMRWQVDQLVSQGVHNAVVLNLAPTGPMHGALSDAPHMLTDQWWDIWDKICVHAEKVGMRLWFYDQIGFSGANLQGRLAVTRPDFVGMELHRVVADVDSAGELALPEGGIFIAGQAVPIDAADGVAGAPIALPLEENLVRWQGAGRCRLMIAYAIRKGFDYHSVDACAALIDLVHGNFERHLGKYFGRSLAGSFQDELPSMPTWSPRFADEFKKRVGYDIISGIAALWEDWGPESARIRIDYQRVRAALAEEALFRPIFDWHERHGLTFGFDQQSPSRAAQPLSTVEQYADYARTHRWYSAPGSDHWGDAKFHSSLAHSYGRPRTWIEAFHSSGWGGTLEETFDWLQPWLLAGANLYDPHAVYYSTKGGQWEWAAPSTCWRQPYWRHYKYFADAVSRLCWIATRGEHVCDVGVLFPSATVQADLFLDCCGPHARRAHDAYQQLLGQMAWFNARPGVLKRLRRDFDVLDDDTVAHAAVEGAGLRTRGERYKVLIVPDAWLLESATARKLVEFAEAGGRLIFVGALPSIADRPDGEPAIARLRSLLEEGRARQVAASDLEAGLNGALSDMPPEIDTASPSLLRRDGETSILLLTAAVAGSASPEGRLPWVEWDYDHDDFSFPRYNTELREKGIGFDLAAQRPKATVRIRSAVGAVEQWDPGTGRSRPVSVRPLTDGVEVTVDFAESPILALIWSTAGSSPAKEHRPESPRPESPRPLRLEGSWTSEIVPTIDNRYGDFTLPAHPGPLPVQSWRLDYRQDEATTPLAAWVGGEGWEEVAVTDGVRGWVFGPQRQGTLPAPLPYRHDGNLDGAGWTPIRYSLSRGIDHDPQHDNTLGPKSRVLEPLLRRTGVPAGDALQVRVALPLDADRRVTLAVGGNGRKTVWWNGVPQAADTGGYLYMTEVDGERGPNILEFRLAAVEAGDLEAYWTLTDDAEAFARPEWLAPVGAARPGSTLVMRRSVRIGAGERMTAALGSVGPATLVANGREIGMQGAFEPYAQWRGARVLTYDLSPAVEVGDNVIEVRFTDDGAALSLLFDGLITGGGSDRAVISDLEWQASRENAAVPLSLGGAQRQDSRFYLLRPRPHPLPRTGWLEPDQPISGVLDIVPEPYPGRPKCAQWFRLPVPPGATRAHLPVVDATIIAFQDDAPREVRGSVVELADPSRARRELLLRVEVADGRLGGAVWDAPPFFDVGPGTIELGSWLEQGLPFYSGGVAYTRTFELDDPTGWASLDLGRVRGTAEVEINGTTVGVRVWSPYLFDVGDTLRTGENRVTIRVFNTLAPYLRGASPTRSIFAGQEVSGLFGPVSLC